MIKYKLINYLKHDEYFYNVFKSNNQNQFEGLKKALESFFNLFDLNYYELDNYYIDISYYAFDDHIFNVDNIYNDFKLYLMEY